MAWESDACMARAWWDLGRSDLTRTAAGSLHRSLALGGQPRVLLDEPLLLLQLLLPPPLVSLAAARTGPQRCSRGRGDRFTAICRRSLYGRPGDRGHEVTPLIAALTRRLRLPHVGAVGISERT